MGPEGSMTHCRLTDANWLQVLEGNIDTAHAQFLHSGAAEADWYPEGSFNYYGLKQRYAKFVTADTNVGAWYGAFRPGSPGYNYWRIGKFMFPFWTSEAAGYLGFKIRDNAWVPMDDEHTMVFIVDPKDKDWKKTWVADGGLRREDPSTVDDANPQRVGILPNTTDWYGRFRPEYNMENDFLMDRELQRELGNFTGMPYGANNEDMAVQVAMGAILPREIENLGTSDLMIIRVRQRLLEAAQALAEHKIEAPGVDQPDEYLGRCGSVMIPEDADWLDYTEDLRKPFVDNGAQDPVLTAGASFDTRAYRHKRNGPMF